METPPLPPNLIGASGWWADLQARYSLPARAYHNIEHILEVLEQWSWVAAGPGWSDPTATWVAALLHDAVYSAGKADNEELSAEIVEPWCQEFGFHVDVSRAEQLIRWTAEHGRLRRSDLDDDAALFLDCDMAILGARPDRFDAYSAAVREEYLAVLPEDRYEAGRRRFLEELLLQPIFLSPAFEQKLGAQARENIQRALLC